MRHCAETHLQAEVVQSGTVQVSKEESQTRGGALLVTLDLHPRSAMHRAHQA